jgi:hypothetical protein
MPFAAGSAKLGVTIDSQARPHIAAIRIMRRRVMRGLVFIGLFPPWALSLEGPYQ